MQCYLRFWKLWQFQLKTNDFKCIQKQRIQIVLLEESRFAAGDFSRRIFKSSLPMGTTTLIRDKLSRSYQGTCKLLKFDRKSENCTNQPIFKIAVLYLIAKKLLWKRKKSKTFSASYTGVTLQIDTLQHQQKIVGSQYWDMCEWWIISNKILLFKSNLKKVMVIQAE